MNGDSEETYRPQCPHCGLPKYRAELRPSLNKGSCKAAFSCKPKDELDCAQRELARLRESVADASRRLEQMREKLESVLSDLGVA